MEKQMFRRSAKVALRLFLLLALGSTLGYAQSRLYGLMHRILRNGDPAQQFYGGFYLLQWDHQENKPHSVNYADITEREFCAWMTGKLALPSLFDMRGDS